MTRRREIEDAWKAILAANEPTVLKAGEFQVIEEIARQTYTDMNGDVHPMLTPMEIKSLSITRGSLTTSEIDEIRSHVVHTKSFLSQIPWGRSVPPHPGDRRLPPREAQRLGYTPIA